MILNLHLGIARFLLPLALGLVSTVANAQTLALKEKQETISAEASAPSAVPYDSSATPDIAIDTTKIPQELKAWLPWIETKNPTLQCAWKNGQHACLFIGALEVVRKTSKTYVLNVSFYALASGIQIEIPKVNHEGGTQEVKITSTIKYIDRNNATWIALPKGKTNLEFEIPTDWRELYMPQHLNALGRQMLALNAKLENGRVIRQAQSESVRADQEQTLNSNDAIQVFRHYQDGYPARLRTKLLISSNENAKIVPLGKIIPSGFTITNVDTNASLNQHTNGTIDASVNRGNYYVDIDAYANQLPENISTLDLINGNPTEYWSIQSNNNIRQIDVQAKNPVDPTKTGSFNYFGALPSYAVEQIIALKTLREGIQLDRRVDMTVRRTSWFGFSNSMLHLDQTIINNHGIDTLVAKPGITIQGATLQEQPQVIYKENKNDAIQLPLGTQHLKHVFASSTTIPLSSWNTPTQLTNWTLYTAPRHHIVWASSDHAYVSVPTSWEGSWNLYKIFSVFLLCLVTYKSFGPRLAAVVGLGMLTFSNHFLFSWSYWIVSLGILGILHFKSRLEGSYLLKFSKWSSVGFILFFGWSTMLFIVDETRAVFNPGAHLESTQRVAYDAVAESGVEMSGASVLKEEAVASVARSNMAIQAKTSSERYAPQVINDIGQDVAQAMSPTPSWHQWNVPQFQIYVQNIQHPEATVKLWIAGPTLLAMASLIQVLILLCLLAFFANTIRVGFFNKPSVLTFLGKST